MGLLTRLIRGPEPTTSAPDDSRTVTANVYTGDQPLEVVGESHYQDALWRIVGGRRDEHVRHRVHAVLIPEPENPYDPNAIAVRIEGQLVGYLPREDAGLYRPGLLRLMEGGSYVALVGAIVGGGQRADGPGSLGVFLDHDPSDFGLESDDDFDDEDGGALSRIGTLSADEATAIGQLRELLESERTPVERHYMLNDLEARLYKMRERSPTALKEFDAVCLQHDREMRTIRPALVKKFGGLPVVPMYRQASIRWHKAQGWQASREWAERGIAFYGADALNPETVDDLRTRSANAQAKLRESTQKAAGNP